MDTDSHPQGAPGNPGVVPPAGALWHICTHSVTDKAMPDPGPAFFELLNRHLAWVKVQHDAGSLLFSGPSQDMALGIFVFAHLSTSEVEALNATEPLVQEGFRAVETIIPWNVHQIMSIGNFRMGPPGG